jgi:hypothetical protein
MHLLRANASTGFSRLHLQKKVGANPEAVGKRVFCSNRNNHTGCGRTVQLYLDSTVRYLHYAGCCVVAFVLSLTTGMTIQRAYQAATGTATPRNAYRWLNRLAAQLSFYRSLSHQPPLQDADPIVAANRPLRAVLLISTFKALLQRFVQPLCASYQRQLQRSFL